MPQIPTLTTPRLVLRPFTAADGPAVERHAGTREVADTTLTIPHPYPEGGGAAWIATHADVWAKGHGLTLALSLRDEPTSVCGAIGLGVAAEHRRAELGYWVAVGAWGNGYATEAARAVVAFAFDAMRLHRVQARHFTRNEASGRVMRKIGMTFEGVMREAYLKWGRFEDVAVYAVLASEWEERLRKPG